ncbi:MAG TPA: hypothetical protein PKY53_03050 [Clostridia bacterium]|jgi:hypothetical protein|nr:hypothetical protein [Clostridia bacterium]
MEQNNSEITITRIETILSAPPVRSIIYDLLRNAITITKHEKLPEKKDDSIVITITFRYKL